MMKDFPKQSLPQVLQSWPVQILRGQENFSSKSFLKDVKYEIHVYKESL